MAHQYYLAKTDPETYSISQFAEEKRTVWDGVRNAQALRAIAAMKKKDRVFIYHSMGESAIMGLAQVVSDPRPSAEDPKLTVVELEFLAHFDPPVTLREIKDSKLFEDWALVRQSRLSTMAVPDAFVAWIRKRFHKMSI